MPFSVFTNGIMNRQQQYRDQASLWIISTLNNSRLGNNSAE
ncbi:hypothetical protein HMPREF1144_6299 [Klebsiella sp. OBRC7]|nr:hypothetical protein HMPREF1144_6299 [Klebsiella sp. OBRC7]